MPVAGVSPQWSWRLDGRRLGPAVPTHWPMWPGRHVLELVDARQQVKEVVRFEVRGAQVKPPATPHIARHPARADRTPVANPAPAAHAAASPWGLRPPLAWAHTMRGP